MQITVNGKSLEIQEASVLDAVLRKAGYTTAAGIAAAVNDEVVPFARWNSVTLKSQDRVLIITASQGG